MQGLNRSFFVTATITLFLTLGVLAIGPASATSTWGAAQEVAASLNTQNNAYVNSVSCSSAGNCSAAGLYRDSAGYQAFVVDATAPVTPTTTVPTTTVPVTATATLAATGINLTLPLGLATALLGLGGLGVLELQRRRRRI